MSRAMKVVLLLAACVLALGLVGCGSKSEAKSTEAAANAPQEAPKPAEPVDMTSDVTVTVEAVADYSSSMPAYYKSLAVAGWVENTSPDRVADVRLVRVTTRDESGGAVGNVAFALPMKTLGPGEKIPFSIVVKASDPPSAMKPVRADVTVEDAKSNVNVDANATLLWTDKYELVNQEYNDGENSPWMTATVRLRQGETAGYDVNPMVVVRDGDGKLVGMYAPAALPESRKMEYPLTVDDGLALKFGLSFQDSPEAKSGYTTELIVSPGN